MNPNYLTLALTTPLEQLLELPNAIRIASSAREDLQHFSHDQLQEMLTSIDAMITNTVAQGQATYGSGLVRREEQRDLDWLLEASSHGGWLLQKHGPNATERDHFRVLALYKLGWVIAATAETPPVAFISPVVATLMEALESLMLADLLPESVPQEQILEEAWRAGLSPETKVETEVRKAQSQAGRNAASVRHLSNRAAKQKGLALYFSNTYRTEDGAYRIIGAQVCRAPGTVKNWILAAKKAGTHAE